MVSSWTNAPRTILRHGIRGRVAEVRSVDVRPQFDHGLLVMLEVSLREKSWTWRCLRVQDFALGFVVG